MNLKNYKKNKCYYNCNNNIYKNNINNCYSNNSNSPLDSLFEVENFLCNVNKISKYIKLYHLLK